MTAWFSPSSSGATFLRLSSLSSISTLGNLQFEEIVLYNMADEDKLYITYRDIHSSIERIAPKVKETFAPEVIGTSPKALKPP